MNVFQMSSEKSIKKLQEKSRSIIDVFSKTIDELSVVNSDIKLLSEEKVAEKAKIDEELALLANQEASNQKVIENIKKVFI